MQITSIKFKTLSLIQKGELTFQNGIFIGQRSYYNQKLCLYDLGDFFVEVWFEPNLNRIRDITTVEDLKIVDRYIDANS